MTRFQSLFKTLVLAVSLINFVGVQAATYSLRDNIVGSSFFDSFEWQAIDDPTHGRVWVCYFSKILLTSKVASLNIAGDTLTSKPPGISI